jgi:hypothetical protein
MTYLFDELKTAKVFADRDVKIGHYNSLSVAVQNHQAEGRDIDAAERAAKFASAPRSEQAERQAQARIRAHAMKGQLLAAERERKTAELNRSMAFANEAERFIDLAPLGSIEYVSCEPVRARPGATVESLRSELADLRSQITPLVDEGYNLKCQPHSRERCIELVDLQIKHWEESAARDMGLAWGGLAEGRKSGKFFLAGTPGNVVDLGPFAVMLLGAEAVRAALLRSADVVPEIKDRAGRLTEITAELDVIERKEERVICELHDLGEAVERRANARVEIVLGVEPQ